MMPNKSLLTDSPILADIIGGWEIVLILVVSLALIGARKLPELIRRLGEGFAEFLRCSGFVVKELDQAAHDAGESLGGIYGKARTFCVMKVRCILSCAFACSLGLVLQACHRERASLPPGGFAKLEIVGSARFSNQVHQAVLLLKERDSEAYAIVTKYVGRIQEGETSGMLTYMQRPTYEMSKATAFYSLTWCAATIAHDSFHSKLFHDYQESSSGRVPDAVWTGRKAERQCMAHQLAVMRRIGASQSEIEYARRQADGKYVTENETWDDYEKRNW